MDKWYEELVTVGEGFGLQRDTIDIFEGEYDRRLKPLDALILRMHVAGLCSENGDFGPEWQGIGDADGITMGETDEECWNEEEGE